MKQWLCWLTILLMVFSVDAQRKDRNGNGSNSSSDSSSSTTTGRRYDPETIERPTDVKNLIGQEAPYFSARIVHNGDGRNELSSFFGEVVILHIFQTENDHSNYAMGIMQSFHRKYAKKGVSIIACTPEQDNKILAMFLTSQYLPYRIFVQTSGVTSYATYVTYTYVIGAENKVVWQGLAVDLSDKVIRKAVSDHKKYLYRQYKKISKSTINKLVKRDYGGALRDVNRILSKSKNKESEKYLQAKELADRLELIPQGMMRFAGQKWNNRDPYKAMSIYRKISKEWKSSTALEDAKGYIKEMETESKRELEADRVYHKVMDKLILGKRKNKKAIRSTVRNLEAILRRYEDTEVARKALEVQVMLKAMIE